MPQDRQRRASGARRHGRESHRAVINLSIDQPPHTRMFTGIFQPKRLGLHPGKRTGIEPERRG